MSIFMRVVNETCDVLGFMFYEKLKKSIYRNLILIWRILCQGFVDNRLLKAVKPGSGCTWKKIILKLSKGLGRKNCE